MTKPRLSTIANYFLKAKTVTCLRTGLTIDVTANQKYEYREESNSYTSVGGAVTFWKDGVYAEMKCACENCNCKKTNI